jgi:hypothetical protein
MGYSEFSSRILIQQLPRQEIIILIHNFTPETHSPRSVPLNCSGVSLSSRVHAPGGGSRVWAVAGRLAAGRGRARSAGVRALRPMQRLSGASRPRRFSSDNQAMPIIVACGLSGKACRIVETSEVCITHETRWLDATPAQWNEGESLHAAADAALVPLMTPSRTCDCRRVGWMCPPIQIGGC